MTFISLPVELPRPVRISWALCAAIAVHLLLVASFFIVLAMATTAARADEITCTGNDLVETLEREQPELMAQIRAEAARIPNGAPGSSIKSSAVFTLPSGPKFTALATN